MKAPLVIDAEAVGDEASWRRALGEGRAAFRSDARGTARRRTRLQSAKVLDAAGAYLCDATVQDVSSQGFRLALAKNCGLPQRFGVHLDLTGEVLTAAVAWRRERLIGVRILAHEAPAPIRAVDRAALRGRYYGIAR